ncbi:hypothetical protein Q5P01_023287 [Channa striata]|uniref:Peptidase S1 domain-containing protein n=1 Tax=Channa striata TaxID=64152 RepID=A0AA88J9X7_CHASR|nr:hypothetical protein Q5P01_023287 [Channa striata]
MWILLTLLFVSDCGVAPLNTKIVGGVNATAGTWLWQVSVHLNGSHKCGGTLISDQWVLTAAHCIITNIVTEWTLYFGRVTQNGTNPNEVSRTVSQVIVHPNFNKMFNNDIALMRLSSPVSFTDYIRPICLAENSSQFYTSTSCWATGWGRLGADQPNTAYTFLQEVQIPVVGNKQCSCDYVPVKGVNITNNMICAGQQNKGTCQGDSGGPLQCKQGSVWIQAGITSFGVPCAQAGFPEVYARVSQFQTWIINHVDGANVNFVTYTSNGTDQDSSFVCRITASEIVGTAAPTHNNTTNTSSASINAPDFAFIFILPTMFAQQMFTL